MGREYAEIAIGLPVAGPFHYGVPQGLRSKVAPGQRVWVPFKNRLMVGYVLGFVEAAGADNVKEISSVIDEAPLLDSHLLELTRWMGEYYCASWGQAIEAAVPGPLKKGKTAVKPRLPLAQESYESSGKLKLTDEQQEALNSIERSLAQRRHDVYLLHGVTGSGKTEVYLQAIDSALKLKRSAIVLVPEISLTPQAIERFKARFAAAVAVLHSRLIDSERFLEWKRIKEGVANIVVGARSAVFAPVADLGLIVVDEEQETSYKQQDAPRYHAREVAIMRARLSGATVILGSATPSVETYYNALTNAYGLLKLTERIENRQLPRVEIVDMRQEVVETRQLKIFSRILERAVSEELQKGGQVMLFLNRRGFSTFINCKRCGYVLQCKYCNVSLTYHFDTKRLNCHYCNYQAPIPSACPKCRSEHIRYFGIGTQKVESEAARLFPQASIGRMDTDATAKRGSHRQILSDFRKGKIDILVGTQMIAKGHDFPRVTLVGVICADTALNLPDFRASERTFNLLTQVGGRAGRGSEPGRVIVQTYAPQHYAIEKSIGHDYAGFFNEEITFRRQLRYPPFAHVVEIGLKGRDETKVSRVSRELADILRAASKDEPCAAQEGCIEVVGPAPAFVSKVKGWFRWSVLLKGGDPRQMRVLIEESTRAVKGASSAKITIDVDPIGL